MLVTTLPPIAVQSQPALLPVTLLVFLVYFQSSEKSKGSRVGVLVGGGVGVIVEVDVGVMVLVAVGVLVGVVVSVGMGVRVTVGVADTVGVREGVQVALGVGPRKVGVSVGKTNNVGSPAKPMAADGIVAILTTTPQATIAVRTNNITVIRL